MYCPKCHGTGRETITERPRTTRLPSVIVWLFFLCAVAGFFYGLARR